MKHRKFVKQLMAVGVSRNTAEEAAATAAKRGLSLYNTLGNLLNLRALCSIVGLTARADFERYVLHGARYSGKLTLNITELSLVAAGGYPLGGGGND